MCSEVVFQLSHKVDVNEVRAEVTQLAQLSGLRQNMVEVVLKRIENVRSSPQKVGSPGKRGSLQSVREERY